MFQKPPRPPREGRRCCVLSSPPVPLNGLLCDRGGREVPCRSASSAPSAPSAGVQTLPQPRRDAMVIGERYVPDRRRKAGWGSSHAEKGSRAVTGTRLRRTMKSYSAHLDERRGEMSRQGDGAKGKGGAAVPGPSSLPQESPAEKHTVQCHSSCLKPTLHMSAAAYVCGIHTRDCTYQQVAASAPGTCPERREMESPSRKDDDASVQAFVAHHSSACRWPARHPVPRHGKDGETGDLPTVRGAR